MCVLVLGLKWGTSLKLTQPTVMMPRVTIQNPLTKNNNTTEPLPRSLPADELILNVPLMMDLRISSLVRQAPRQGNSKIW